MPNFNTFARLVEEQFNTMAKGDLFVADLSKDNLWDTYLESFPAGTNTLYKERNEYDCQTCSQFIRNIANVVSIVDGNIVTIWDVQTEGYYQTVADTLAHLVRNTPISSVFLKNENQYGVGKSFQELPEGAVKEWPHFHATIPSNFFKPGDVASIRGKIEQTMQVFQRGLNEIKPDVITTVLELITPNRLSSATEVTTQNSLYRGEEFKAGIEDFQRLQTIYRSLPQGQEQNIFAWSNVKKPGARIRNTAIGTLLQDLSEDMELTKAVKSFESKVAPANYKRTSALVTPGMIKTALKNIADLGIEPELQRRYATINDITINNVLFADRSVKPLMKDSLETMLMTVAKKTAKPQTFDKVEEISINSFLSDVLPQAESLEVMIKNSHVGNLMSVIAPTKISATNILQWDNNFSWSYNGEVTDSMKERVKSAGGAVDGHMRFSIQWNEDRNDDFDLDAHCLTPNGELFYGCKQVAGGTLDIDIQSPSGQSKDGIAVENITWPTSGSIIPGTYNFFVRHYTKRQLKGGFRAQFEFAGEIHEFDYLPNDTADVPVITVKVAADKSMKILSQLPSTTSSRQVWNIPTEQFCKVSSIMLSPNHWDDQTKGNKHTFFILDNCNNPESTRGLYNEFLDARLTPHRKVFDLLGTQFKCEHSEEQLSGLGFSSTKRDELIVKVSGSFTRMLKIKF